MLFSLILPTYNEKQNLEVYLPILNSLFINLKMDYEIIIVDDDSPDGTYEWAQDYAKENQHIRVIRRIKERGLTSALLTGMGSASGEIIGVMDADMQHDESILPRMIDAIKEQDMVIGSRLAEDGSYGRMNFLRRVFSTCFATLIRFFLPVKINDPMSGFFILKRNVFTASKDNLNPQGFKLLTQFLSQNPLISVSEIGYTFGKRKFGDTKFSLKQIRDYVWTLVDISLGRYFSIQFIKYGLIGSSGVIVNLFGQWIYNEFSNTFLTYQSDSKLLLPSSAVAFGFEVSVLSNFVLNNSWTFADKKKSRTIEFFIGFLKFNAVCLIGFFIQYSCWFFLYQIFQTYFPEFLPKYVMYIANLIGILIATISNYQLNKSFTWEK
jgi:dolichol-phosphate mannosyltransferase